MRRDARSRSPGTGGGRGASGAIRSPRHTNGRAKPRFRARGHGRAEGRRSSGSGRRRRLRVPTLPGRQGSDIRGPLCGRGAGCGTAPAQHLPLRRSLRDGVPAAAVSSNRPPRRGLGAAVLRPHHRRVSDQDLHLLLARLGDDLVLLGIHRPRRRSSGGVRPDAALDPGRTADPQHRDRRRRPAGPASGQVPEGAQAGGCPGTRHLR